MSEVTCNTIKDILPLYVDGVVSDDTCNMVAKHLEHCEECLRIFFLRDYLMILKMITN